MFVFLLLMLLYLRFRETTLSNCLVALATDNWQSTSFSATNFRMCYKYICTYFPLKSSSVGSPLGIHELFFKLKEKNKIGMKHLSDVKKRDCGRLQLNFLSESYIRNSCKHIRTQYITCKSITFSKY